MSTPNNANIIGGYSDTLQVGFINSNGVLAKVLADVAPTAGIYSGGQRVYDAIATNTSASDNAVVLYDGVQLSLYANMGVATTTTTTIARTVGSFITDGWKIGDSVMCFGSAGANNNGNIALISGVTSTTITFLSTPLGFTANTEGPGFRVVRVAKRSWTLLPANSGNIISATNALSNVQLIASATDASLDGLGIELGANSMLIAAMYAAVPAGTFVAQISAKSALR